MKIYQIGICDDEKNNAANLESIVYDFFTKLHYDFEINVWYSGEEFCYSVENGVDCDILFLDINLPNMNGVDVGKYIREKKNNQRMQILYISSETSSAMELFQVHPYDFLIKPIEKEIIINTLNKLLEIDHMDERFFLYQINRVEYKIMYGKIMYISSNNKHINVSLSEGTVESFVGKLNDVADKLPTQFVRVSQSFIINLKYVRSYRSDKVVMENNEEINITTPYRKIFKNNIIKYNEVK